MIKTLVLSSASATLWTLLIVFTLHVSSAQVMQSTNFQIQSDSVNVGGTEDAASTNFGLRSTIGEIATGESSSASYILQAGYRQTLEVYMALSAINTVTMTPSIPGVSGGTANGSTTVTVTTDSPSGYELTIESENDPAMQKGADTIADYAPGVNPSYNFTVNGGEAVFGFSPEGDHIVSRFRDNGSLCGTGGSLDNTLACWDGLATTSETIASDTNPNHPNGSTTTVRFRVGLGANAVVPPGTYVATTTITALPL